MNSALSGMHHSGAVNMNELGTNQATVYIKHLDWCVRASRSENHQCGLLKERTADVQEEPLTASLLWQVDDSSRSASAQLSIPVDGFSIGSMEIHGGGWQMCNLCVLLWGSLKRGDKDIGLAESLLNPTSVNLYTVLWTTSSEIIYMSAHKMYRPYNMNSVQWL